MKMLEKEKRRGGTEEEIKTEDTLTKIILSFDKLAKIQERTQECILNLAEAQKRTEEALATLTKRVDTLSKRVDELAEAQKRTEEALATLTKQVEMLYREHAEVKAALGKLTDVIGFGLEDIARIVLPGWLYRHLSIDVEDLRREYFIVDGEEVEVNLFGEGTLKGERVVIIGEAKSRIYVDDVNKFYWRVYRPVSEKITKVKTIGIMFGFLVHPSARKKAEGYGIYTVASYER